ncbi:MAG: UvrD-helicase domain-containing protein [Nitrospiraceae bacterium]|nr:UvrD-helicase domain-containing protein [Nitrospiraceae bacterium]
MKKYLDISKSVVISSPAGSGKTEKLARRYISLLESGSEIERILCITFTDKAAAEMKERILNILEKENTDLFLKIKDRMPLIRISTIHAFCLKLLKRFSIELGLDPSIEITDEFTASLLWTETVYECLMEERETQGLFFEMMKERGIKGFDKVYSMLHDLYNKRPVSEMLLETNCPAPETGEYRILQLFSKCLERYRQKKNKKHLLDFNDLELLTYNALLKHSEWQNILYAFDEHTDHILVDEFQDTNFLQWKIIDKLTEEWRSGIGSKRDTGKIPTIFLVGDDKQSIYLFRGANSGVFEEAKKKLSGWLGEDYFFQEIKENYRSLPPIINFTNNLFQKIMSTALIESWRCRYLPFEATRSGDGHVELILLNSEENTKKNRTKEASAIAKRINSLIGSYEIYDQEKKRPCIYADMAILLKRRTHLSAFENALRKESIPFIVVKGIGFYDEPEVALLRELVLFIVDPFDDYSLFCILRSPLFGVDYNTLLSFANEDKPLFLKLKEQSDDEAISKCLGILSILIEKSKTLSLAIIIEDALTDTGAWQFLWEKQRLANIKKFIKIIESYETAGYSNLHIREKLIRARDGDEPKANINTEGMNAVKIMTIHAAKGLQFPIVFLPSMDEPSFLRSGSIVIDEDNERFSMAYEEDSAKRNKIPLFVLRKEKELEEEKRLFYVAVTRARDLLCMVGVHNKDKQASGRLGYLMANFDIAKNELINKKTEFFDILTESDVNELKIKKQHSPDHSIYQKKLEQEQKFTDAIFYEPESKWQDVTEDIDIRSKHGKDWVLLGIVLHKIFEEISKGILTLDKLEERSTFLLRNEFMSIQEIKTLSNIIVKDIENLRSNGYLEKIILPRKEAFCELPFMLERGKTIFKGRIDRVIIDNGVARIYDYKTFPVKDSKIDELAERYKAQMKLYKEAASKIFHLKTESFILFTHKPLLVSI